MDKAPFFFRLRSKIARFYFWLLFQIKRQWQLKKESLSLFFSHIYKAWGIEEIPFFCRFLTHRYDARQFNVFHVQKNMRLLFRLKGDAWVTSSKDGRLIPLKTPDDRAYFTLMNALTLGALQKRVERVILFTYLTLTLELNNPFDKKKLLFFLEKKIALLKGLLDYVKRINGKKWDQEEIRQHISVFRRNSLLQARVIQNMHRAVKKERPSEMIIEAKAAMEKGLYPVLALQGLSGAYWMRGPDRRILGLFKPFDEEIHAPNNPVGPRYRGAMGLRKTRRGCRVGESAHHEVAAFLVDEHFGFGIVPRTYYAQFSHRAFFSARENLYASRVNKEKLGSFQEYVGGFVSLEKLSREEMEAVPLDEFQLLVVLDVILGNTDRNSGNILFGEEKIAAIDHGLCFTDAVEDLSFWYWSFFEQGKKSLFKPIVEFLNAFPFESLELLLRKRCFISLESLQRLRERVVLFTEGVNQGLVPAQMEDLFTREYLLPLKDRKSTLKQAAQEQIGLYIADPNHL